jgi:hypothetical protein
MSTVCLKPAARADSTSLGGMGCVPKDRIAIIGEASQVVLEVGGRIVFGEVVSSRGRRPATGDLGRREIFLGGLFWGERNPHRR